MATKKWGLDWEAGQSDDGTWSLFRPDPTTHKIIQEVAHAWVDIKADTIEVQMEILDMPPIPPSTKNPDGSVTTFKPFDLGSVRMLVSDLILYDFLYPDVQGKTFAKLTYFDKMTGAIVREFTDAKF
jgi:hypothetical protein